MSRLLVCLAAVSAALAAPSRADAGFTVTGTLTSEQTATSISPAVGTFYGDLDDSGPVTTLTFTVTFADIDTDLIGVFLGASFQLGSDPLTATNVRTFTDDVSSLDFGPTVFTGVWSSTDAEPLTAQLVSDLLAGNIYFNISTLEFPEGEVRGQLVPTPAPGGLCLALSGAVALGLLRLGRARPA